jgi:hypothetical protein
MDEQNVETFLKSRTIQMLIAVLAAYAVKNFGVPFMPTELQTAATEILTVAIPLMIAGAMWFRAKAQTIIKGWWN